MVGGWRSTDQQTRVRELGLLFALQLPLLEQLHFVTEAAALTFELAADCALLLEVSKVAFFEQRDRVVLLVIGRVASGASIGRRR